MTPEEIRETIRQMLKDWNAAMSPLKLRLGFEQCNCDFAEQIRNTRRETLSRMRRPQLETEERRAMEMANVRRITNNRKSKDDLITSILYFESLSPVIMGSES